MAAPKPSPSIFTGLSIFAIFTLWVLMSLNGTLETLLRTAWTGVFPDNTPLKKSYSGIKLLDLPISILVAFFYGLANLVETAPYLLLADLVAVLLVINMMTLVESCRTTVSRPLRSSALWQYLWNCAGVGLFLPLYSHLHVKQRSDGPTLGLPASEAQALPFTALCSLLLPIPLLVPALVHASPFQIQNGLVMYFLTPAIFISFHTLASTAISRVSFRGFAQPVKTTYWIVGISSALGHLGIVLYAFLSSEPSISISSLYLPDHRAVQRGQADILTAGALLFFQWDLIIINLVVLLHGMDILEPKSLSQRSVLIFASITAVFGPGSGLALALWRQEDRLEAADSQKSATSKSRDSSDSPASEGS